MSSLWLNSLQVQIPMRTTAMETKTYLDLGSNTWASHDFLQGVLVS